MSFRVELDMNQTEAFRLLASADRQLVLHELVEKNGKATVEELSKQVAVRRHRIPSEKIRDEQVDRARVRLVHVHFPQLLEKNVISINWGNGSVSLTDGEYVERLFDAAEELENWPPDDLLKPLSS